MDAANLLITAMAVECLRTIKEWNKPVPTLPKALDPEHLEWMCESIEKNADTWTSNKLHRWIGYVQCAMIANQMLDLKGVKAMFDKAKIAYGDPGDDLLDHLNEASSYEMDLGGEG